jgi:DNA-binding transcriptional LysR family regulator
MALDKLKAMAMFAQVVTRGSFRQAAQDLGVSAALVSQTVAELEAELAVQLLRRTTRRLSLTDAGEQYLDHCRRIIDQVGMAEQSVRRTGEVEAGVVRLQIPAALMRLFLADRLKDFFRTYPQIRLEVISDDRVPDFWGDRLDAAVFVGGWQGSGAEVVAEAMMPLQVCATPEYWAEHGMPRHPLDLEQHERITLVCPEDGRPMPWNFRRGADHVRLDGPGRLMVSSCEAGISAMQVGAGVFQIIRGFMARELRDNRLQLALPDWVSDLIPLTFLAARRPSQPARVQVALEFLERELLAVIRRDMARQAA